jgi:branched-chain amino acid transport system substrate-binding protein
MGNGGTPTDVQEVFIPGIYDLTGATGEVGTPGSMGSRDAITYVNNSDFIGGTTIRHEWVDYAYEIEQARQAYDDFSQDDPAAILGWGTPDTEGLAPQVARDEVVYVSGSYSENLMCPETDYNFYTNLDYTSQNRAQLQWIADNDAGSTVATVTDLNNPFGTQIQGDTEEYAGNIDVSHEGFVSLSLGASSATSQVSRLDDMAVDYVIGHLTAAPFQALIQDSRSAGLGADLLGTTWSMDETRTRGAPGTYEGARTVNAFKTMDQVLTEDTRGAGAVQEAWANNQDGDIESAENANLNYVRGFIHALSLAKAIKNAKEAGMDPSQGANLREGMFAITDWDAWGLALPMNFQEGDRRATMEGLITQSVEGGDLVTDTTAQLPRNEAWITEDC